MMKKLSDDNFKNNHQSFLERHTVSLFSLAANVIVIAMSNKNLPLQPCSLLWVLFFFLFLIGTCEACVSGIVSFLGVSFLSLSLNKLLSSSQLSSFKNTMNFADRILVTTLLCSLLFARDFKRISTIRRTQTLQFLKILPNLRLYLFGSMGT